MHAEYREDEQILAAQRGDRDAFSSLYEANVDRVYRYLAARLGQPADVEDITTEVFIRAMQALPSYRIRGTPFIAWLFRIARNQAINYFKKRERRQELPLPDNINDDPEDPEEEAMRNMLISEVSRAMDDLTDLQKEVLSLRFAADLSVAETAKTMNRSLNAVKFLQFSALRALKRRVEELGGYEE
ncbi:MAG: sigma-70 family RNA polymerase sigma factor [Dehalococcoidia bacterium]|nr:sigma-70 family RNA polymerase sigma factor [Dehalococcoidia bacterium]